MDEDRIRERAYAIWEREGRPEGRHDAHWEQARAELEAEREVEREAEREDGERRFRATVQVPDPQWREDTLHPSGRNSGGA